MFLFSYQKSIKGGISCIVDAAVIKYNLIIFYSYKQVNRFNIWNFTPGTTTILGNKY